MDCLKVGFDRRVGASWSIIRVYVPKYDGISSKEATVGMGFGTQCLCTFVFGPLRDGSLHGAAESLHAVRKHGAEDGSLDTLDPLVLGQRHIGRHGRPRRC